MAIESNSVVGLQNATVMPRTSAPSNELGQVDFMKLIIAQMRNQNPLEPQSDADFMAQLAQFESLNQMRGVASSMKAMQGVTELSSASAMLGRTVVGRQVDATGTARDLVARERFGASYSRIPSEMRVRVNEDPRVIASIADAQNAGNEVAGRVDRVIVGADGIPMLLIGTKVVDLFTVEEVR